MQPASVEQLQQALEEAEAKMVQSSKELQMLTRPRGERPLDAKRMSGRSILKMARQEASIAHELLSSAQEALLQATVPRRKPRRRRTEGCKPAAHSAELKRGVRIRDPGTNMSQGDPPNMVANACYSGSKEDAALGQQMLRNYKKYIQCPGIEERSWGLYTDIMRKKPQTREVPLVTVSRTGIKPTHEFASRSSQQQFLYMQ